MTSEEQFNEWMDMRIAEGNRKLAREVWNWHKDHIESLDGVIKILRERLMAAREQRDDLLWTD